MAAYTHDVLINKFVSLVLPSQQRQTTRWRSRSFVNVFAGIHTCISFKFSSTKSCSLKSQFHWFTRRRNVSILYMVIIVFYLKMYLIKNGNQQLPMIIKELFEGPVGDYCIVRNTINCLFSFANRVISMKHLKGVNLYVNQLPVCC